MYDLKVSQQSNGKSAVNQVQISRRWVEPNQCSVPKQCSNIGSFSGPSLSAHANFDRPRRPKPRVLARPDFYLGALESLSSLTGQQMKKKSAGRLGSPGLADFLFWYQISHDFFRDSWRQKNCFFSIFGFFGGSWHMLSDWRLRCLNILLKSVIRIF